MHTYSIKTMRQREKSLKERTSSLWIRKLSASNNSVHIQCDDSRKSDQREVIQQKERWRKPPRELPRIASLSI